MKKVDKLKLDYARRVFYIKGTTLVVPVALNQNIFRNIEPKQMFHFDGTTFIKIDEYSAKVLYGQNDYTYPVDSKHSFWSFTPVRPVYNE